jgi:hypothetical protein
MGNPAKAFVYKALARTPRGYQQSYPQKNWMTSKVLMDQALKPHFTSSLQQTAPSHTGTWST